MSGETSNWRDLEADAEVESRRLIPLFDDDDYEGLGIACVAGIEAAEVVRRLSASIVEPEDTDELSVMWITDVPGGCVIAQPWGYAPTTDEVLLPLAATTAYAMYANPKSGDQGMIVRDGEIVGSDLFPGGGDVESDDENALLVSLYENHAVAYCFAFAGLRPVDSRSVGGPPDLWIRL